MPPVSHDSSAPTPPMLKHWREMKAQHRNAILFYRVGDFYEMFNEDAELAARILDIALTSRGDGVPLAGVPVKAAAEYLRQLVGAGHRVAICEQVEDPKLARGLVRREVVETITPGALLQDGWVAGSRNNWLVALQRGSGPGTRSRVDGKRGGERRGSGTTNAGLAAIDLSTGEFTLETVRDDGVAEALGRLSAAEIVMSSGDAFPLPCFPASPPLTTSREPWEFDPDLARDDLRSRFGLASLDGLG